MESSPKSLQIPSPALAETTHYVYEFGPFRLETAERLLLRAGDRLSLTPKAFDTLLILVRSNGHLLRKQELMQQLWPDAVVEEANLARNVWAIRKALGEKEGEHAYIETIPKIGYRFVAPVAARPAGPDPLPPDPVPNPAQVPAAAAATPARRRPRLFVAASVLVASVIAIAAATFWNGPTVPAVTEPAVESGITFLTDGSHDDTAASWAGDGRIHFSRAVTGTRTETWTMNADGSNPQRANTAIRGLLAGRWSPDGKKVIFTKEAVPGVVYLADADGGHEVTLPFGAGNLDWSPDSSQFAYQALVSGTHQILLYTIATGKNVTVAATGSGNADPSFSPDGTRIAFTSWRDGNAEIYVMHADGSNVRRVTNHPAFDNYPVFSPDGTQLAFQSNREDEHVQIYLQDLDDDRPPVRLTKSTNQTGLAPNCWSPDGTRMLVYTSRNGRERIGSLTVDPFPTRLLLSDPAADLSSPGLSEGGRELLYQARVADRSLELRLTDLPAKRTRVLYATAPDYPDLNLNPTRSPDGTLIAFSARIDGNSEIFTIKPDGTGLRNLTRNPLLDASPAFSADGREIMFARDAFGQAQLYRMDTNGGGQRRVTTARGYEMSPAASPDGRHVAFAGDRGGRGLDILGIDLADPAHELVLAARRGHDNMPAYSPDGTHIAFVANSDSSAEIYMMKADGTGLVRITRSREDESSPQFASGGTQIVFSRKQGDKLALYQVDVR